MKHRVFETSILTIKRHPAGFTEYDIVTTYWSDGSKTIKEVPGKIHFLKNLKDY